MSDLMYVEFFRQSLLGWFDVHGRKDLPWQRNKTGYRVWVSEIMLQQTQVATVIPYYLRFMARFPTLAHLAEASQEEVLHLWTGLGYYARGRNLHKAAQQIHFQAQAGFPERLEALEALPGIGRSTAAAILSLAFGQAHAILDGNVKRILARFYALEGWTGEAAVLKKLWALAEQLAPESRCGDFNQALMDLGSSLCRRRHPNCSICPLNQHCQAYQQNLTAYFPVSRPRKALPEKSLYLLMLKDKSGAVLLEKRPAKGIWGGLWSFPEFQTLAALGPWLQAHALTELADKWQVWPGFRHTFTHFHLDIQPIVLEMSSVVAEFNADHYCWYQQGMALGLPKPIKTLLGQIR